MKEEARGKGERRGQSTRG